MKIKRLLAFALLLSHLALSSMTFGFVFQNDSTDTVPVKNYHFEFGSNINVGISYWTFQSKYSFIDGSEQNTMFLNTGFYRRFDCNFSFYHKNIGVGVGLDVNKNSIQFLSSEDNGQIELNPTYNLLVSIPLEYQFYNKHNTIIRFCYKYSYEFAAELAPGVTDKINHIQNLGFIFIKPISQKLAVVLHPSYSYSGVKEVVENPFAKGVSSNRIRLFQMGIGIRKIK